MSSNDTTVSRPKPLVCDIKGLARLLADCDVAAVLRELDAGKIPAPVLLCDRQLWRIAEIREWLQAGCPDRATWERTAKEKALPVKRKPARKATPRAAGTPAPAGSGRQYDNFKIPKPGRSVFAWCKEMEKVFETKLVEGMASDGRELGWGDRFAEWDEQQVNAVCLGAIRFLRTLPTYKGQYEYLFDDEGSRPPWEDAGP